jgi:hypothetical protein
MKLNQPAKIMLISSAIYFAIWSYLSKSLDIQGALIYIGIAGAVGFIVDAIDGNKKWDFLSITITGAAASAIFNIIGQFAGWFTIDLLSVIYAMAEQGLMTGLIWTFMRGRK